MRVDADSVREDGGEEGGERGVDREGVEVEGEVDRRIEAEEVVDGGGRRRREARDWEVEEGEGLRWRESEVVVVEKVSSHFLKKVLLTD